MMGGPGPEVSHEYELRIREGGLALKGAGVVGAQCPTPPAPVRVHGETAVPCGRMRY